MNTEQKIPEPVGPQGNRVNYYVAKLLIIILIIKINLYFGDNMISYLLFSYY